MRESSGSWWQQNSLGVKKDWVSCSPMRGIVAWMITTFIMNHGPLIGYNAINGYLQINIYCLTHQLYTGSLNLKTSTV